MICFLNNFSSTSSGQFIACKTQVAFTPRSHAHFSYTTSQMWTAAPLCQFSILFGPLHICKCSFFLHVLAQGGRGEDFAWTWFRKWRIRRSSGVARMRWWTDRRQRSKCVAAMCPCKVGVSQRWRFWSPSLLISTGFKLCYHRISTTRLCAKSPPKIWFRLSIWLRGHPNLIAQNPPKEGW